MATCPDDAEKGADAANEKMLKDNQKRQEENKKSPTSGTTPSSDKLLQAKFN